MVFWKKLFLRTYNAVEWTFFALLRIVLYVSLASLAGVLLILILNLFGLAVQMPKLLYTVCILTTLPLAAFAFTSMYLHIFDAIFCPGGKFSWTRFFIAGALLNLFSDHSDR